MNVPAPLADQLTAEYGDVLPPTLITSTVAASDAEETARADVAALADAVVRSGAQA